MSESSDYEPSTIEPVKVHIYPRPWNKIPLQQSPKRCIEAPDEQTLAENLQTEYWWVRDPQVETCSDPSSCFNNTLRSSTTISHEPRVLMSEYQVVRECLWILIGSQNSFIFTCFADAENLMKNVCLYARRPASLTHISNEALDSYCHIIARNATCVLQLRAFVDFALIKAPKRLPSPFICLAEQCEAFLEEFILKIDTLEHAVRSATNHPITLIACTGHLKQWFRRLSVISDLILQVCSPILATIVYENTSVLLLNKLDQLRNTFTICVADTYLKEFFRAAYVATSAVYLTGIRRLFYEGRFLTDVTQDMPFLRVNMDINARHPEFWRRGLTFSDIGIPRILQPIKSQLLIGIKSLVILNEISSIFGNTDIMNDLKQPKIREPLEPLSIPQVMINFEDFDDTDLVEIARAMASASLQTIKPIKTESNKISLAELMSDVLKKAVFTSSLLRKYLWQGPLANNRFKLTYSMQNENFCLSFALKRLADVALFRAGDYMDDFCQELLTPRSEQLLGFEINNLFVDVFARICGSETWPVECMGLEVSVKQSSAVVAVWHFVEMKIRFDVPWPFNIILTEDAITTYSRAFTFLFQVKRAKWALEKSKLWRCDGKHKLAILRLRFLFVINGLHTFLADHIETSFLSLMHDIETATNDFEGLLQRHNAFVKQLQQICLLENTESQAILHKALVSLFDLCSCFELPGDDESRSQEEFLAKEYTTRVAFLTNALSKAIVNIRQSSPLLEILQTADHFNVSMDTRLHFL